MNQRPNRSTPMPVKHWSFAGLILTYRCPASCACCYLACRPDAPGADMSIDHAVMLWTGLAAASPHGCRVHLAGGEPFLLYEGPQGLCEIIRHARRELGRRGLLAAGPLDKIETNAFWATDETTVRRVLLEIEDECGAGRPDAWTPKLAISADPYHQQFVPIARPRLAAQVAAEVLGPHRVQVRWQDWLANGHDVPNDNSPATREVLTGWANLGRDRFNGRAAWAVAPLLDVRSMGILPMSITGVPPVVASSSSPPSSQKQEDEEKETAQGRDSLPVWAPDTHARTGYATKHSPCAHSLLRSKHVHIDPDGRLIAGTCAGIVLGQVKLQDGPDGIALAWQRLSDDHAKRPIVGALCQQGPMGLLGLFPQPQRAQILEQLSTRQFAGKCQLCFELRSQLHAAGLHREELAPDWLYASVR